MKQFILPKLPYDIDALSPHLSKETLEYHYGKHHSAYIDKLNTMIGDTDYENMSVEEIITRADNKGLFNNAAQAYNHSFYWNCMTPNSSEEDKTPSGELESVLIDSFGSLDKFKEEFTSTGATHFGSGWVWLFKDKEGKIEIKGMHDADTPIKDGNIPLLTLDVWEHAYYIDYRNIRTDYISAFWKIVNWDFVQEQLVSEVIKPLMVTSE